MILFVFESVCLSFSLSVFQTVCLSVCLSFSLSLSISLSVCLSVSIFLSVCLSPSHLDVGDLVEGLGIIGLVRAGLGDFPGIGESLDILKAFAHGVSHVC